VLLKVYIPTGPACSPLCRVLVVAMVDLNCISSGLSVYDENIDTTLVAPKLAYILRIASQFLIRKYQHDMPPAMLHFATLLLDSALLSSMHDRQEAQLAS